MSVKSFILKFWVSSWWIPFWFITTTLGAGVAFSVVPAITICAGVTFGVLAHALSWSTMVWWRPVLRILLFGVAGALFFLTLWGFTLSKDLGLALITGLTSLCVILVAIHKHKNDQGRGALYGWASSTNSGPWMTPLSTSISPSATQAVVTADFFTIPVVVYKLFKIRQGAPISLPTWSILDYILPLFAALGFLLGLAVDRPDAVSSNLKWFALMVGFLSSAAAVGSLMKESGHKPPPVEAVEEFFQLVAVRTIVCVTLSFVFYSFGWLPAEYVPLIVAAVFSVPTVNPPSLAVLYGYHHSYVVHAAVRAGFPVATLGVIGLVMFQKFF